MKHRILLFIAAVPLLYMLATGCSKTAETGNAVYLANSGDGITSQAVTVDENGGHITITPRAAETVGGNVQVSLGVSAAALEAYNQKWGTSLKLLPESYYALSSTSVQINAGSAFAAPVRLNIKPLDASLPDADKYAIPVTIAASSGLPALESAKTVMVLVNRVIITTVPYLSGASLQKNPLNTPYSNLKAWTFEWRCNPAALNANNKQLIMAYGPNTEFFTRFGDVVIKPNQLQVKFGAYGQFSPEQEFQPNKWYHFAVVYDGSSAKWYADGKEIMNVPLVASFNFDRIQFASSGFAGMVNEIRFWSVVRSPAQIVNNMYAVDPKTNGLEGYWKCNDGEGKIFKDATGNGNDMTGSGSINWTSGVRMPAE